MLALLVATEPLRPWMLLPAETTDLRVSSAFQTTNRGEPAPWAATGDYAFKPDRLPLSTIGTPLLGPPTVTLHVQVDGEARDGKAEHVRVGAHEADLYMPENHSPSCMVAWRTGDFNLMVAFDRSSVAIADLRSVATRIATDFSLWADRVLSEKPFRSSATFAKSRARLKTAFAVAERAQRRRLQSKRSGD